MDENENVWKANMENGLIMACIGLVYTLLVYFLKSLLNPVQGYILYAIEITVLFFMLRSFRDKKRGGFISYGQSFGAGMVIFVIYAVVMALFGYILYKFIDPNLIDQQIALVQNKMVDMGLPQNSIDMAMEMQKTLITPVFTALSYLLNGILYGVVFSLVVSIFIKKEANPLLGGTDAEPIEE